MPWRELRAARLAVRLTDTLDARTDSPSGSPTHLTLVRFSDQFDARFASKDLAVHFSKLSQRVEIRDSPVY